MTSRATMQSTIRIVGCCRNRLFNVETKRCFGTHAKEHKCRLNPRNLAKIDENNWN